MLGISQAVPRTDYEALEKIEQDNTLHEVTVKRGILGRIPSILSIVVITMGVYLFAIDVGLEQYQASLASLAFFAGAVKVEDTRTKYFAEILSYFLKNKIGIKSSFPFFGLIFFLAVTAVFTFLDVWSGKQGGTSLYNRYVENGVKSSLEYKAAKTDAKSGVESTKLYMQLKEQHRADKAEAQATCTSRWRLPSYRTKNAQCMDAWNKENPAPKLNEIHTSTEVSAVAVSGISAKVQQGATFIMNYLAYIIMALSLLLTLFAIIEPINQFRKKKQRLEDPSTVEKLKNRWDEAQRLIQERLEASNKIQKEAHKKRNKTDEEIEALAYEQNQKIYHNTKQRLKNNVEALATVDVIDTEAEPTNNTKMLPPSKAAFIGTGVTWKTSITKPRKEKEFDFDLGAYNDSTRTH